MSDIEGLESPTIEWYVNTDSLQMVALTEFGTYHYQYDYVNWGNINNKVKIICPEHGEFFMTLNNHINMKQGCPKCHFEKQKGNFKISTEEFIKKVNFYEVHVFKYSRRKGTTADKMPDQIDDVIKTERSNILLSLTSHMKKEYIESYIGTTQKVLVEEKSIIDGNEYSYGYTPNYIRVHFPSDEKIRIKSNVDIKLLSVDECGIVTGHLV